MQDRSKVSFKMDIRVRILLLIGLSISALLLKSELSLMVCLIIVFVYVSITTSIRKALPYVLTYFVFGGILYLLKDIRSLGNLPLLTVYVRRLLMPVMMSLPIMHAPTGQLIASLNQMKVPKAATLSLSVLFRFMPTIIHEYHAVRETQRFRGIGVSAGKTLLSLPRTMEYILVPMLIRTSRVADELTASAQVRGVKLGGKCSSYHLIRMRVYDWYSLIIGIASIIGLFAFDARIS